MRIQVPARHLVEAIVNLPPHQRLRRQYAAAQDRSCVVDSPELTAVLQFYLPDPLYACPTLVTGHTAETDDKKVEIANGDQAVCKVYGGGRRVRPEDLVPH